MPARKRTVPKRRPNITKDVRRVLRDMARTIDALSHIRADRILVVAGEARRNSRATIRPLRFPGSGALKSKDGKRKKPVVHFKGKEILYVLTLRPLFFRSSTPEKRVETLLHELFHVSTRFDGTLDEHRRHRALPGDAFEKAFRPLVKRYLAMCDKAVLDKLRYHGDVLARQWLEKPAASYPIHTQQRTRFADAQTFLGPVKLVTRPTKH